MIIAYRIVLIELLWDHPNKVLLLYVREDWLSSFYKVSRPSVCVCVCVFHKVYGLLVFIYQGLSRD